MFVVEVIAVERVFSPMQGSTQCVLLRCTAVQCVISLHNVSYQVWSDWQSGEQDLLPVKEEHA